MEHSHVFFSILYWWVWFEWLKNDINFHFAKTKRFENIQWIYVVYIMEFWHRWSLKICLLLIVSLSLPIGNQNLIYNINDSDLSITTIMMRFLILIMRRTKRGLPLVSAIMSYWQNFKDRELVFFFFFAKIGVIFFSNLSPPILLAKYGIIMLASLTPSSMLRLENVWQNLYVFFNFRISSFFERICNSVPFWTQNNF